jgi:hypothetical protein
VLNAAKSGVKNLSLRDARHSHRLGPSGFLLEEPLTPAASSDVDPSAVH